MGSVVVASVVDGNSRKRENPRENFYRPVGIGILAMLLAFVIKRGMNWNISNANIFNVGVIGAMAPIIRIYFTVI
jgi:hypothetical protein